jgi:hypothetical protein
VGAVLAKQNGKIDSRLSAIEGRLGIPDQESARLLQLIKKARGTQRREPSLHADANSTLVGSRSHRRHLQFRLKGWVLNCSGDPPLTGPRHAPGQPDGEAVRLRLLYDAACGHAEAAPVYLQVWR